MKGGTKSSLICLILHEEPMVQIILKHWELVFMLIVESEEYTSRIDFIVKNNCRLSLSSSFPYKSNNENE